jgi:hypothetical protein
MRIFDGFEFYVKIKDTVQALKAYYKKFGRGYSMTRSLSIDEVRELISLIEKEFSESVPVELIVDFKESLKKKRKKEFERRIITCKDCGSIRIAMFMIDHELWASVCKKEEILCFKCFEKRLGREVTINDFLPSRLTEEVKLGMLLQKRT